MSIYSVIAFNSALGQMKKNEQDAQSIQSSKLKNQQAQEDLDLSKSLDMAKMKQARNEGMISDYIGSSLEKQLSKSYKSKQDVLDATSDIQDKALHDRQQQNLQLGSAIKQLHAADPDVQNRVANMFSAIKQQGQPVTDVSPETGGESQQAQMSVAPGQIPSFIPQQPQQPVQTGQGGDTPSENIAPAQRPSPQAEDRSGQALLGAPEPQEQQAEQAPQETQQPVGGIDLSPLENTYGMPKGSLWINPETSKPEINPIWKAQMESRARAKENYNINQPFREEQRQDRNIKTAETYLVNSLKQRGGAIGLQNNKVDAAIHARSLINQAYDPATGNYNVTQVPYGELSESIGTLVAGQSVQSEGRIASLKQRTAQGDLNGVITYFTGKPSNATSQAAIRQLVSIIDRQGELSEELRNKAFEKMKMLPTFKRLDSDTMQELKDTHLGNSYNEFVKDAPDKQPQKTGQQKDYSHLWGG